MVKKQKEETPNINAISNRDIIQRLNFLYQASVYLQSLEPSGTSISVPDTFESHPSSSRKRCKAKAKGIHLQHTQDVGGKEKKKKKKRKQTTGDLARSYVQCMRVVGQKTTVKMYKEQLSHLI